MANTIIRGAVEDLRGARLSNIGTAHRSYLRSGRFLTTEPKEPVLSDHPGYDHQKITEDAETLLRKAHVGFLWFYLVCLLAVLITIGVALV